MGLDLGSTWRTCSPGQTPMQSQESLISGNTSSTASAYWPGQTAGQAFRRQSADRGWRRSRGRRTTVGPCWVAAAGTALASTRLLVPVLAAPAQDSGGLVSGDGPADHAAAGRRAASHGTAGTGAEKTSEMSIPALVGQDGRLAVPAFTCLDALTRWRPGARPVPVDAGRVWQSAVADARAVVLDVAGPVPVAIDGARLAALSSGQPVPLPHDDPDVLAEVAQAVAGLPAIGATRLSAGGADGDLTVELAISPGYAGPAAELARSAATAIMARLGTRLRRGVQVVIRSPRE